MKTTFRAFCDASVPYCHTPFRIIGGMDNYGAVTKEVVLRNTVRTRLRLNSATKRHLWSLRQQQREFYNKGVEIGLFAHNNGDHIPSNYTSYTSVLSAVRKDKTHRWARQNLTLQRSGLNAGSESVRKWSKHRKTLENNLAYWKKGVKKDPEYAKALRKHSVAEQKLSKHREAGTKRLFRKRNDEEAGSGAALVYGERARLIATERGMAVRLPGGLILPLRDKTFTLPDGHTFTGAVQVVDITDIKGKVTKKTHPRHRTYNIHLSCTMKAPAPIQVENEHEVLGVDIGINHPVFRSDGVSHSMPEEDALQKVIGAAQQKRARCREGSRRWRRYNREIASLSRTKTNRRHNGRSHIAKDVATTSHVSVGVEDLKAKAMSSTAKGTKDHPGVRVAQKRGLNRGLQGVGVRSMLDAIGRSCRKNGKGFLGVLPHYTSQTCSLCGELGRREKQAFVCTSCGARFQADFNASRNVRKVAYPILMLMAAAGSAVERRGVTAREGSVTNKHS